MQNVTEQKQSLRNQCRQRRLEMSPEQKTLADEAIFQYCLSYLETMQEGLLYCYVSMPTLEVDTSRLIDTALSKDLPVAVPKCIPGTGQMEFYRIQSRDQLQKAYFGLMEPDASLCEKAAFPAQGICIVPGLAFDRRGLRLGWGKGFYDRFLVDFQGMKIGLCYECCMMDSLPYDDFDQRVDLILTEAGERRACR